MLQQSGCRKCRKVPWFFYFCLIIRTLTDSHFFPCSHMPGMVSRQSPAIYRTISVASISNDVPLSTRSTLSQIPKASPIGLGHESITLFSLLELKLGSEKQLVLRG